MSAFRWSALVGLVLSALVGLVLSALVGPRVAEIPAFVLMLGPGVVVPLGLALAIDKDEVNGPLKLVRFIVPLTASAGVLGWLEPPGRPLAMAVAAVHAVGCALVGLVGLARLWRRRTSRFGPLPEIAIDVGLLLLPIAGVWFFVSRAATSLMGFGEPVVTFTAAHFFYAGFAAPIIIGGVGRLIESGPAPHPRRRYAVAAVTVCAGVPLTALGIAANHTIEVVSAIVVASGMLVASTLLMFTASRRAASRSRLAAALFVVAGMTLLLTMTLAASFALTSSAGRGSTLTGIVPLQAMIAYHGFANALGFALPGLVALTLVALED